MRLETSIYVVRSDVGEDVFKDLERLFPQWAKPYIFDVDYVPADDPRLAAVINLLEQHGWYPGRGFDHHKTNFSMSCRRVYDRADLDAASYFECTPAFFMGENVDTTADGNLRVKCRVLPKTVQVGTAFRHFLISDDVKNGIEKAGLKHILFQRAEVTVGREPSPRLFWEITSDYVMPPVAMHLITSTGEPFDGDYSKGCLARESLSLPEVVIHPPQMRYTAQSLANLEPFDMANTYERWGNATKWNDLKSSCVFSKRFYDFCAENGLTDSFSSWSPIRLV